MSKTRRVKGMSSVIREDNWKAKGMTITTTQYDALLIDQDYCCAICGRHQDEFGRNLAVDHDHISKEIRGLLCTACNLILGCAKDSTWILKQSIKYLSRQICLESLEGEIL